jgi:solute carrier family 50 protein (sugar transporter)
MCLNCILWGTYGSLTNNYSLLISNSIGFVCACYYIWICFDIVDKDDLLRKCSITLLLYIVILYLIYSISITKSTFISNFGFVCSFGSILLFASPLSEIFRIVRERNAEGIFWSMTLTSILCTISWVVYGILVQNRFILVPNFIGFLLSLTQLALKILYKPRRELYNYDVEV